MEVLEVEPTCLDDGTGSQSPPGPDVPHQCHAPRFNLKLKGLFYFDIYFMVFTGVEKKKKFCVYR